MFVVDNDFVVADIEGVDSNIIVVDETEVVVVDVVQVVVEFDFLIDPEGNVFDDSIVEAVEDGASFEVVSFIFDI